MSRSPVIFPSFVADYTYFLRTGSFLYFDTLNSFSLLFTSLIWGGRLWAFSLVFKIKRKLFIKKSRTFPNHLDFTPSILFATKFYKMSLTEFRTELPIIWLSAFIRKLRCYALFKSRFQFRTCITRWQFLLLLLLRLKMKTHLMRRTKIGKSKSLRFDCLASKPFRTITEKKNLASVSQKRSAMFKTFVFSLKWSLVALHLIRILETTYKVIFRKRFL